MTFLFITSNIADPTIWRRVRQMIINKFNNRCLSTDSQFVGDEHGKAWDFDWIARSQWQNNDGGPWNW